MITALSEATGLGRASLYHHFPGGKDEMVAAALDDVEAMMDGRIIAALRQADLPPAKRLEAMAEELAVFHEGGRAACLFGVLALTAPTLQPRLRQIFGRWLGALAGIAEEAGRTRLEAQAAAEEALASLQGALILDDFALQSMDPTETSDFYELIVERHQRTSTIVTSNRDASEWIAVMSDPLLAQSAIDRLVSTSYELVIEGESYRRRQRPQASASTARRVDQQGRSK